MTRAEWRGQRLHHRQRGRDRSKPQPSGESMAEGMHFLAHRARVADYAARPFEHALAFRSETLEPGTAVDQQDAESVLELLYPGRQSRLGHPAGFGRPAKML